MATRGARSALHKKLYAAGVATLAWVRTRLCDAVQPGALAFAGDHVHTWSGLHNETSSAAVRCSSEFQHFPERMDAPPLVVELGSAMIRLVAWRVFRRGVYFEDWFFDAAILSGLFVAFRVLATFLLWRKGRYVF